MMEILLGVGVLVGGMILLLSFLVIVSFEPVLWISAIILIFSICYLIGYGILHEQSNPPTWNIISLMGSALILFCALISTDGL